MNIHILQNIDFEDEAYIGKWTEKKGHTLSKTKLFLGEGLPDVNNQDFIIILGGPMNVYEENLYPFLTLEKKFIEKAVKMDKKVLGICLGAQLISDVLGGKVTRNKEKEIGWFDIEMISQKSIENPFFGFPVKFKAFLWHGDMFSIPPGAVHVAKSEACENQAFVFNGNTAGLQFHLESIPASVNRLIKNCGNELTAGKYIQKPEFIINQNSNYKIINELMERLLNNME